MIKPGREKSLLRRHPWIFSGAIQSIDPQVQSGDLVDIFSSENIFLARGYVNRRSQIVVRVLTWNEAEAIDERFWRSKMERAITLRAGKGSACRLINAESDGLPGLIVDRYEDWLVLQAFTAGIERVKMNLVKVLLDLTNVRGIYERSEGEMREKEGLRKVRGTLFGEEPPDEIEITEEGINRRSVRFLVDVKQGQKTGFYLDQQENRIKVAAYCQDAEVLNVFSYTGGFTVHALVGNAVRVFNLDSSMEALALAQRNVALNGFEVREDDFIQGNTFNILRRFREEGRRFDVIILDPPKFAPSLTHLQRATRAYKDINLLALQMIRPEGILVTFSCSGLVFPDLFQKIVFGAALDAGCEVQIIEKLSQARDHPIRLSFPEGEYLKGLVCRV